MKRLALIVSTILVISLLIIPLGPGAAIMAQGPAASENPEDYDRYIVHFKSGVSPSAMAQIHSRAGGICEATISRINSQVVKLPRKTLSAQTAGYLNFSEVDYIEPDYKVYAIETPNDTRFGSQWGMTKIQTPQAWNITHGNSAVKIAILDTGIDADHPDLASKIVKTANFSTSSTADDLKGHGTHVAGIAAAITDNSSGVAGVAYNASLMNVKVLGDNGSGYHSAIAQGIIWAADNGANVINMSLGGSSSSSTLQQAVDYAWSKGVVVVAAAGNSGSSSPSYPGYYSNVISVAATDSSDRLYSFSNYGSWVDVAAPGSALSTYPNNSYATMSGTSMASPFVAGLAGLVWAVTSDASGNGKINDEVRTKIESTTDSINSASIARGRINAYKAVSGGSPSPTPTPTPSPTPTPATGTISGKVTNSSTGSAISGAIITAGPRSTTSNSSGSYTLSNVPSGSYTVTVTASGYQTATKTVTVASGSTVTANFALTASQTSTMWVESLKFSVSGSYLYITAKVVNPQPVSSAQITLTVRYGSSYGRTTRITGSDGTTTFRVYPLIYGTTYNATVTGLVRSGYTWDSTKGIKSASYTPTRTATPTPTPTPTPTITPTPSPSNDQIQTEAFNLINNERVKAGLTPLIRDTNLEALAREHVQYMIQKNTLSHDGFSDRAARSGYSYVGENVAMGYRTAQTLVNGWMSSSGHQANILNSKYKYTGLVYIDGWACQIFGG